MSEEQALVKEGVVWVKVGKAGEMEGGDESRLRQVEEG